MLTLLLLPKLFTAALKITTPEAPCGRSDRAFRSCTLSPPDGRNDGRSAWAWPVFQETECAVFPSQEPHKPAPYPDLRHKRAFGWMPLMRAASSMPRHTRNRCHEGTPFPGSICASVNDVVVHGIPNDVPLKEGDIISVDCGTFLNGFCGDIFLPQLQSHHQLRNHHIAK